MGTRRDRERQEDLWIATSKIVETPGHAFHDRLGNVLRDRGFDRTVEQLCRRYYRGPGGRPSIAPGIYFRMMLIGYFEGLDSERGIAWRVADSLSLRKFLGYGLDEKTPDHSTVSRTRRLFWVSTHSAVFAWVPKAARSEGLVRGETIAVRMRRCGRSSAAIRDGATRRTWGSWRRKPDHEDEGRPHTPGAQGRARGGSVERGGPRGDGSAGGPWGHGKHLRDPGRSSADGQGRGSQDRRTGGGQGIPQQRRARGPVWRWGEKLHLGAGTGAPSVEGEGARSGTGLRKSPPAPKSPEPAASKEARRAGRTNLRPHVRNGRPGSPASAWGKERTQTVAVAGCCVQSRAGAAQEPGSRHSERHDRPDVRSKGATGACLALWRPLIAEIAAICRPRPWMRTIREFHDPWAAPASIQ